MELYNNQERSNASVMVKHRKSEVQGKEGTLYLQVICDRLVRQVKLPYKVYPQEWDKKVEQVIFPPGLSAERQAYLLQVETKLGVEYDGMLQAISRFHAGGNPFTTDDIVRTFKQNKAVVCWNAYMEELIANRKAGGHDADARHLFSLKNSFSSFLGGEDIPVRQIGEGRIVGYEAWLVARGLEPNTVSFYLRYLRNVWNRAVVKGLIEEQPSPFRNVNTRIEKTKKKAVSEGVIHRIKQLSEEIRPEKQLPGDLSLAAWYFLFCYYTQGMAFVDLAYLTKENIQGGYLVYARHKTGEKLQVKLLPVMKAILRKFQSNERDLLFPILSAPDASYQEYENALRGYNNQLMRLGRKVGAKLSSYVPRHSWATNAKRRGATDELISQGMGHTSLKTTDIYIDRKNNEKIDGLNKMLIMGKGKIYNGHQRISV